MTWQALLLTALIAGMITMPMSAVLRARRSRGRPAPDTTSVDGGPRPEGRRVYYFHAPHCGHCRAMTPLVARLVEAGRNLVSVDVAQHLALAKQFGVAATPSCVLVEGGIIRQVWLGALSERQLLQMLEGSPE